MKLFSLAVLAAAASAAEWGNPYGDRLSGYRAYTYKPTPSLPRLDGPRGPRYGPRRPTPRYGRAVSQVTRRGPSGYFGGAFLGLGGKLGGTDAQNIVGDGMGDGYGHGRGFAQDDVKNLEADMNDRDQEFDIEADMDDQDLDQDLEIKLADRDIESELEDADDAPRIMDTTLYGKEGTGRGFGSVRQVPLPSLAPGRAQKTLDQSYTIQGRISGVDPRDAGVLNRGNKDIFGLGQGGAYNREKGYQNIRDNIRDRGGEDNRPDDDTLGPRGDGQVAVYGGFRSGFGNRGGFGKAVGLGRAGAIRGPRSTVVGNPAPQRIGRYGAIRDLGKFAGYGYGRGYGGYGRGLGGYGGYGRGYGGYGPVRRYTGPTGTRGSYPALRDISTHPKQLPKW